MDDAVEFGVLGPIRAVADGASVAVGSPREKAVLARLVVDANRVVSVDRLIDAVWQDEPPSSARSQIAIVVHRLRRGLGGRGVITTASPGYVMRLASHQSDLLRFDHLVARGRSAAADGDLCGAAGLLREALSLWRGAPLEDLPGLRGDSTRLEQGRLDVVETWAEVELELGHHVRVGEELAVVVAEHPLRERVRAQLMLAQYRAGRRADALRTYQEARRTLIEQIGLEPGPELRRLHEQILRDSPALTGRRPAAAPAVPVAPQEPVVVMPPPSQLPHPPRPFAGRDQELELVDDALRAGPDAAGTVVLVGEGEVGKTALGLRWAHRYVDRFPDGQLHADLHDRTGAPVDPSAVLDRFLRALGVRTIPVDFAEKVALYRSSVAHRRVLVFLDNAADSAQVLPLLPGGAHSRVIVTGRGPLDDLVVRHGAHRLYVEPLCSAESWDLLVMLLGQEWVAQQPHEARRLVSAADGNPLSLRTAAARVWPPPGRGRSGRGRLVAAV
ncbi:BTAD domain-containing putative transcriptional regulator [Saccharothrix isguenensis]